MITISAPPDARCHRRRFPADNLGSHKGSPFLPPRVSNTLKTDWQRQVLACSGYIRLYSSNGIPSLALKSKKNPAAIGEGESTKSIGADWQAS
jgi:hypothetical protein